MSIFAKMPKALTPNSSVPERTMLMITGGWLFFVFAFWFAATMGSHPKEYLVPLLPRMGDVWIALVKEWNAGALFQLISSLSTSLEAIFFATVIGLGLSYLGTIPAFRPIVSAVGKLRFLSLAGVILVFLMTFSGHAVKVAVLTFSMVTFIINDMMQAIDDIPESKFDHARTVGFSDWQILREVVIRGTLAEAFETIRMNAAIAWMMIAMVEGLSRSEGGIGLLLINLQRNFSLAGLVGIQIMIFLVGIGQDQLLKMIKAWVCPYTVRGN